jgi:hypothetical protein
MNLFLQKKVRGDMSKKHARDGNKESTVLHGGWRPGAGRKASPFASFWKRFRATPDERKEFASLLTGDARKDFVLILEALRGRVRE